MRELRYKVGDKVLIKSNDWYEKNCVINGDDILENIGIFPFSPYMAKFCGQVLTIKDIHPTYYTMEETAYHTCWTDEMIECKVEEETLIERFDDNGLPFNEWLSHKGAFYIPDGYELKDENGNVINATKIVLEKKKKEYPTTIEECCEILGLEFNPFYTGVKRQVNYKDGVLHNLKRLLIYRDAYWKIAGEEMELDGPWEPDWLNDDTKKYVITSTKVFETFGGLGYINYILTFPTEEMRDAFYENFDKDLEFCKELL